MSRPKVEHLRRDGAIVLLFVVLTAIMVMPPVTAWNHAVTGDNGDSVLNLWIMDWVWHHAGSWSELWRGQLFQPHTTSLAYSEALFPQSLLFGIFRAATFGSSAAGFNAVLLVSWTASLWWTYRLLRRVCADDLAAIIGSVAWNFSAARLGHIWHFQLVTAGALVPLVILLTLRLLDKPTVGRGIALGLSLSALVLAASYYGLMMVVAIGFLVAATIVRDKGEGLRSIALPLVLAGAIVGVLVLPVWLQYAHLQRDPYFRRTPEAEFSTTARDLLVPASTTRILDDVPIIEHFSARNVERQMFPGFVTLALAPVGLVAFARRRTALPRRSEIAILVLLGGLMLLLSAGDRGWLFGVDLPGPYRLLRALVPPFNGIRAPSRFGVLFELALCALAAVGIAFLGTRVNRRWYAAGAALLLVGVLAESAVNVPTVDTPNRREWSAVNVALAAKPDGLTLELPIMTSSDGVAWPFIEAPRQYLARIDDKPRVNGYSGFEPKTLEGWSDVLNTFPSDASVRLIHELGVRYVIVRTGLVGEFPTSLRETLVAAQPPLAVSPDDLVSLGTIRPDLVRQVRQYEAAWLVELR
jgi:hypothetical protein